MQLRKNSKNHLYIARTAKFAFTGRSSNSVKRSTSFCLSASLNPSISFIASGMAILGVGAAASCGWITWQDTFLIIAANLGVLGIHPNLSTPSQ
jgi:hypothetical protein